MANHQNKLCHVGNYATIVKKHVRLDVCRNLPIEYEVDNNVYCILHAPKLDKDKEQFERVFQERIRNNESYFQAIVVPIPLDFPHCNFTLPLNFTDATFLSSVAFYKTSIKYIYFDRAKFCALAQFHRCNFGDFATFTGAVFAREAWFTGSKFKENKFDHVSFCGPTQFNSWVTFDGKTDFSCARFLGKTEFDTAKFESSVSFEEAEFAPTSQVSFYGSSFLDSVSFKKAILGGYLNFEGNKSQDVFGPNSSLSLRKARLESPEKLSFHSVRLRPSWFIDTDSRKFVLTNIKWESGQGKATSVRDELEDLENSNSPTNHPAFARHRLLSTAFRQLGENAETNNRFDEASRFRRLAFETERLLRKENQREWLKEKSLSGLWLWMKRAPVDLAHFLYRVTSHYGESSVRALMLLLAIVLLSALLYWTSLCQFSDKEIIRSLGALEAVPYALRVMFLQRPDPFPSNTLGRWVVSLETILAPLQLALLALALRRKFMR